jgi:hypothetical protein
MVKKPTINSPSAEFCWLAFDNFEVPAGSQAVTRVKMPATGRFDSACDTVAILQLSNQPILDAQGFKTVKQFQDPHNQKNP